VVEEMMNQKKEELTVMVVVVWMINHSMRVLKDKTDYLIFFEINLYNERKKKKGFFFLIKTIICNSLVMNHVEKRSIKYVELYFYQGNHFLLYVD
jgi:hypothetical protein